MQTARLGAPPSLRVREGWGGVQPACLTLRSVKSISQRAGRRGGRARPCRGVARVQSLWVRPVPRERVQVSPWLWRLRETQVLMKATRSWAHWRTRVLMHTGTLEARSRERVRRRVAQGPGPHEERALAPSSHGGEVSTQPLAPALYLPPLSSGTPHLVSPSRREFQKHHTPLHQEPLMVLHSLTQI